MKHDAATRQLLAKLKRQSAAIELRKYNRLHTDPQICGGAVRIIGTRLTAECLAGRFFGGETISAIATDYVVPVGSVEQCIRIVGHAIRARKSCEFVLAQWRRKAQAVDTHTATVTPMRRAK